MSETATMAKSRFGHAPATAARRATPEKKM
jgi:hypothetical protein